MLEACGLVLAYGRRRVLDGVDLALRPGEIVALLGANGSGKTTLLRCLLGLARAQAGTVRLDGERLAQLPRRLVAQRLAYVPQTHAAPFPYTVREIVALGRLPHHGALARQSADDRIAVEAAIAQLGLGDLAARRYTELSGGERQLALIARALAQGARLLVMDEPISGLDYGHQFRLLDRIEALAADGYGILKSTHYPDQALACASRVALLRDGRIEADGAPAELVSPAAIRRLYGVDVELLRATAGGAAFVRTRVT